ncbi:TetR/AcrR family transcriptional regulator [Pseudacidovorax sp. NFM-22]|uniref:TetR/AcrR family transcriptional regulator n=1 Tax=Pseudacidovorax sp. NFM-22 TaxID=2744469 RepID=UPI001F1E1964|nr:TetR/AcrR family transcriptional regulator [Pseudacidovorax sp. NFM-22]
MRVKTKAKRDMLLLAASQVFREKGFEGASMGDVAARAASSKATLYGYFSSKEELFVAVTIGAADSLFHPIFDALSKEDGEFEPALRRYGEKFIIAFCSPEATKAQRAVIAEAGRSDVGRQFYEQGPKKGMQELAVFLERHMQRGSMRRADPLIAAQHLTALIESETLMARMLGFEEAWTRAELRAYARRAIDAFLNGYGCTERAAPAAPEVSAAPAAPAAPATPATPAMSPAPVTPSARPDAPAPAPAPPPKARRR